MGLQTPGDFGDLSLAETDPDIVWKRIPDCLDEPDPVGNRERTCLVDCGGDVHGFVLQCVGSHIVPRGWSKVDHEPAERHTDTVLRLRRRAELRAGFAFSHHGIFLADQLCGFCVLCRFYRTVVRWRLCGSASDGCAVFEAFPPAADAVPVVFGHCPRSPPTMNATTRLRI